MKRILHFAFSAVFILCSTWNANAQNIGISSDGSLPDPHAMLDIKASDKGLLIPRTSTTTRLLIPNTKGLLLYDTTTSTFWFNDGTQWQQISNGSSALNGTTNYIAKFTGPSTAGNSQIYDNGQYVGIGTTSPLARLHVIDSSVLFSASGDIPSVIHDFPISNYNGRRMMWYVDKAAFRAGYTLYDEWNSVNIGNYSVGMGYGNRATGLYSVSLGNGSGASGISSTATGDLNNANGDYTFSTGQYSTSKKPYCFSAGYTAEANGQASIAMGYRAEADGDYGVALGNGAFAPGLHSVSLGNNNAANGPYSFACGFNTKANGNASFSSGNATTAAGDYSFASGAVTQATGMGSTATGSFSVASGDYSTAMGSSHATNSYCVAMGANATASGGGSFALGSNVTSGGFNSFVWGQNSNTTGSSSLVMGINLFDGGHKGNAMLGDTDPWNAGSVGSGTDDQMICRFNNGYYFLTGGNTNRTGMVANHGDNSWSLISDSTKKEKIVPVNGEELLNKISTFTLCTWNYKGQDPKTFRHYGPMAQDFHKAFGHDVYGTIGNDTLINQGDFLGVSFTAIAALEKRTEKITQQQDQITQLEKENKMLIAENEKLQSILDALNKNVSALNQKVEAIALIQKDSSAVVSK